MRFLAAFLLLFGTAVGAETVVVQSGEHEGFSRLVIRLSQPSGWRLGRAGDDYELRLTRSDVDLDLTTVFDLIPRSRIKAVDVPQTRSALRLSTSTDTFATAFEINPGTIVVDVTSGRAPGGSPFEMQLDPAEEPLLAQTSQAPSAGAAAPLDPMLDLYWRNSPLPLRAGLVTSRNDAPLRDLRPDPRVAEAERLLLMQLGRAASQGILTLELPPPAPPNSESGSAERPGIEAAAPPLAQDQMAIRSETVFDRDAQGFSRAEQLTPVGRVCLSDSAVDVATWLGNLPVSIQLGDLHRQLVGEFDRPSQEAILALARLYLAMGLGAEVGTLFDSFAVEPPDADILRSLAAVMDERPVPPSARLIQMADCDGAAALWAVLANPALARGDQVNVEAVERTFSALPLHLRVQLGARLSQRLLALGAADAARRVRDAITRVTGAPVSVVNLIDAQMEIAGGEPEKAQQSLVPVIAENGPDAPGAMVMYVDSVLQQASVVDQMTIEAVAALAFEHRDAADGAELARAHVLAAGSAGQFDRAFGALAKMPAGTNSDLQGQTTSELFALLAQERSDTIFVEQVFRRQQQLDAQQRGELQQNMAARLLDLGFASEALRMLRTEPRRSDQGRILRARAFLMLENAAAAVAEIAGLGSADANRVRAEAMGLLGDHSGAERAYALAGAEPERAAEAWRSGAWPVVAENGTASQRGAVVEFGLAGAEVPDPAAAAAENIGPLAQAQALLEKSRAAREVLGALLAETAAN
jgi:hypothetical protein